MCPLVTLRVIPRAVRGQPSWRPLCWRYIGADVRPNWKERWRLVSRLSDSLEQFATRRHVVMMTVRFVPRRVIKAPKLLSSSA